MAARADMHPGRRLWYNPRMPRLKELLSQPAPDAAAIAKHLDALPEAERVAQVVELKKADQVRLWELSGRAPQPIDPAFLVPGDAPRLAAFPFEGKNSLPAFSRFRKVFYRTKDGEIGGYNDQARGWLTGPGYYMVRPARDGEPGPVVIDYTRIPGEKPDGWPRVKSNEAGISRLVYGGMNDYLRRVSADVVISQAWKYGKPTPNYFVLCRARS